MDLKGFIVRCSSDKVKEKSAGYHEKCSEAIISYLVASEAYHDIVEPPVQPTF